MVKCNIDITNKEILDIINRFEYKHGVSGAIENIINEVISEKDIKKLMEELTGYKLNEPKKFKMPFTK